MHVIEEELLALALGEVEPARAAEVLAHVETCAACARELAWARAERALIARRPAAPADARLWAGVAARLGRSRSAPPRQAALAQVETAALPGDAKLVRAAGSDGAAKLVRGGPGRALDREGTDARTAARAATRARRGGWVAAGSAVAAAVALFVALRPAPRPAAPPVVTEDEGDSVDPRALAALDKAEGDYRHAAAILEKEYEAARPRLDPGAALRWDASLRKERAQLGGFSALAAKDPGARLRVLDGYAGYLRSLQVVIEQSEEAGP